jgi:biopolymer transport protein ExbD
MFIVVVPLLELDRVMLASGKQNHAEPKNVRESSPVTIHVKQNNSIWVGKQEMNIGQLQEWLTLKHQQNPHVVPQLFHDRQAQFGTYQKVKNALESAGYESMDVILNSP